MKYEIESTSSAWNSKEKPHKEAVREVIGGREMWVIEINNLKELLEFVKENGGMLKKIKTKSKRKC